MDAETQIVEVSCACGETHRFSRKLVGRVAKCPKLRFRFEVPQKSGPASILVEVEESNAGARQSLTELLSVNWRRFALTVSTASFALIAIILAVDAIIGWKEGRKPKGQISKVSAIIAMDDPQALKKYLEERLSDAAYAQFVYRKCLSQRWRGFSGCDVWHTEAGKEVIEEHEAWHPVLHSANRVGPLKDYLEKFPNGIHVAESDSLLREEAAWTEALKQDGSPYSFRLFLNQFPKSRYTEHARSLLADEESWESLESRRSESPMDRLLVLDDYSTHFPEGRRVLEARNAATAILSEIAREENAIGTVCRLHRYMLLRPAGALSHDVRALLFEKLRGVVAPDALSLVHEAIHLSETKDFMDAQRISRIREIRDDLSTMGFAFRPQLWPLATIESANPTAYVRFRPSRATSPYLSWATDTPLSASGFLSGDRVVIASIDSARFFKPPGYNTSPPTFVQIDGSTYFFVWGEGRDTSSGDLRWAIVSAMGQKLELTGADNRKSISATYTFLADLSSETSLLPLCYGTMNGATKLALDLAGVTVDLRSGIIGETAPDGSIMFRRAHPVDVNERHLATALSGAPSGEIGQSSIWQWFSDRFGDPCSEAQQDK